MQYNQPLISTLIASFFVDVLSLIISYTTSHAIQTVLAMTLTPLFKTHIMFIQLTLIKLC